MKGFKLQNESRSLITRLTLLLILLLGGATSAFADGKTLPYSYGFETALATEGWTMQNCYTSGGNTGLQGYGTYAGSNCFRFYGNSSYVPQYLISPELSTSSYGLNVSFYHKGYGKDYPISFYVGYSTTDTSIENFTWGDEMTYCLTTWINSEKSFPAGTKYVAIKYNSSLNESSQVCRLFLDDFSFSESNPYKTPTDFTLESFTASSATFSWTAGNSETAWQFAYSTSSTFSSDVTTHDITTSDLVDGKYALTGLTEGTTYYARIRANYGSGNYSEWTDKVSFTPSDEFELTINEGTITGGYAPIYGSYTNTITRTQLIIPAASLTSIKNKQITKITFYTADESSYKDLNWGVSTFEVYMKPINNTSFGSSALESWGTKVYNSATVSVSDHKMEITLNTPYNYNDGNLMIGFKQTATGSYKYAKWVGVNGSSNTLLYGYGDNPNNRTNFNPQITFTTVPAETAPVQIDENGYTTFASTYPLDLTTLPSGLKAYKAEVDAENSKVRFTEIDQAVSANTGMLLEGTAGETYMIPVAGSGTDISGSNAFLVNSTGGTFTAVSGYTYFAMKKNSDPLTFATFAPGSVAIPSNKAYLKVLTSSLSEARQLICVFEEDGETTGLGSVENEKMRNGENEAIYNLAGQRVEKPVRGLYIVNGKKMVVK